MQTSQKFTSKFSSNPSFSFRAKVNYITKSNTKDNIPSPNLYSPDVIKKNVTISKFGTAQRKNLFNVANKDIPGPGLYEANSSFLAKSKSIEKQKKPFLNSSQRFDNKQKKIPGPGEYDVKSIQFSNSPKFTIRKKEKTFQDSITQMNKWKPSPGTYQLQKANTFTNLSMSIPKSQRMKSQKKEIPGPGAYGSQQGLFTSQKSFLKKSYSSISQQKRKIDFSIKNYSPGPGNYQTLSLFQKNLKIKRGFSLRSLLHTSEVNTPAPNQYTTLSNQKFRSNSFKIPKERRYIKQFHDNKQIPGPGTYDNLEKQYENIRYKSLKTKFSKSERKLIDISKSTDQLFYQTQKMKKTSPSFSIGHQHRKTQKIIGKQIPGPGAYNPQEKLTKQTDKTYKFPKSARLNMDQSRKNIGPGSYLINQISKSIGVKFSKSKRGNIFQQMAKKQVIIGELSKISLNQEQKKNNQFNKGNLLSLKFNQHKIKQY